jgi:hypothetical protein
LGTFLPKQESTAAGRHMHHRFQNIHQIMIIENRYWANDGDCHGRKHPRNDRDLEFEDAESLPGGNRTIHACVGANCLSGHPDKLEFKNGAV